MKVKNTMPRYESDKVRRENLERVYRMLLLQLIDEETKKLKPGLGK